MKLQNKTFNVLVFGDIIGRSGRKAVLKYAKSLKEQYQVDLLIVNGENASHGNGLNYKQYQELVKAGCDVITMGNHTFGNKEIYSYAVKAKQMILPMNLNNISDCFQNNLYYETIIKDKTIRVVNLLGKGNMRLETNFPFEVFDKFYQTNPDALYLIDYHAEFTAEKNSLGYYLDGKASLIFGTHTHVQTADERILPLGTAYITDVGMCGARESVIGFDYQDVLKSMTSIEKKPYGVAKNNPIMINGLFVTIDLKTKKALSIKRINIDVE